MGSKSMLTMQWYDAQRRSGSQKKPLESAKTADDIGNGRFSESTLQVLLSSMKTFSASQMLNYSLCFKVNKQYQRPKTPSPKIQWCYYDIHASTTTLKINNVDFAIPYFSSLHR
jgi:hypothetical protein